MILDAFKKLIGFGQKRLDLVFVPYFKAEALLQHPTEKWQICGEYEDRNKTIGWVWLERVE